MTLFDNVTAAFFAKTGPEVARDATVIETSASTTPIIVELAPIVAEEPTLHQTFTMSVWPGLMITTRAAPATVRDVPILKIQAAIGSPPAFRVRTPVISTAAAAVYIPGISVCPP
jgi:hypothetical protein